MLSREEPRHRGEDGISLVELIVVVALLMVTGSIFASGLVGGFRASGLAQARMEAMSDLQVGVQRMTRDIRAAAPVQLVTVGANRSIHVRVFKAGSCRRVTYRIEGSELAQYTQPLTPAPAPGVPPNPVACVSPVVVNPPAATATRRVLVRDLAADTRFTYRRAGGAVMDFSLTGASRPLERDIRTVRVTVRRNVRRGGVVEVETDVLLRNQR
ncbi:MAG TPA: type II secretion system protein [Egibacteraceae bacterium]|nr:type II secretion system protein [Egibacteraceae bacterium]